MTTRRGLFALIAGAFVAAKAPRAVAARGWDFSGSPEPPRQFDYPFDYPGDFDALLRTAWDNYRIEPTTVYINGDTYVGTRVALDAPRFDVFGIRRAALRRRIKAGLAEFLGDDD